MVVSTEISAYIWSEAENRVVSGSTTTFTGAFPSNAAPRAVSFWNNYQYLVGSANYNTAGSVNRINVWYSSLNASYYAQVTKPSNNPSWNNMNSADSDGNTLYVASWASNSIYRASLATSALSDIAPTPWISSVCANGGPFSAVPANSTHLLVTCYAVNPSFQGEFLIITVSNSAKRTIRTYSNDYLGAGSLAADGWFYFPAFRALAIHRYNIWTGVYEANWMIDIPCAGCAGDLDTGLWRVRVFSDNRLYTMLYTYTVENNCIRSYDISTKTEITPFLSTGACSNFMWDFIFLPNSTVSWPRPANLPLSGPPAPVTAPSNPPVPVPQAAPSPIAAPTAPSPVSPPAAPAPVVAPVPTATPSAPAPVAPAPVGAPAASPVSVDAPTTVSPPAQAPASTPTQATAPTTVFPRVARLVLNDIASRAINGPEIVSICNQIRALLSLATSDLVCSEEVAPTARRNILASSYIKLNFTSSVGGQAAATLSSTPSLQASVLAVPASITSNAFAGVEIIFDPSPLLPPPTSSPVAPAPVQAALPPQQNSVVDGGGSFPIGAVVGGIIGGLALIALIIIIIVFRRKNNRKRDEEAAAAQVTGTEYMAPMLENKRDESGPLETSKTQQSSVHDWNIDYADLTFGEKIGSGAFGQVMKGRWRGGVVAIKEAQAISKDEFIKEANLMQNLRPHQNVVHLFGICIHKDKYFIVMEFLKGGDLCSMLRRAARRRPLNEQQRIRIALSIASGMLHLHAENILHRDLAARNVLLSRDGDIRISDFGMSHQAAAESESRIAAEVGPIRWMSPESLAKGVYSAKTDVFSYGILLWEIMSDGKTPMDDVPLKDLALKRRDENLLPEVPENSSPILASLFRQCCSKKPADRPTFKAIVKSLSEYLQTNYPDEDSDGPASPRDRAGSVLNRDRAGSVIGRDRATSIAKKNYAAPTVESTPEDETTNDMTSTVPSVSGAVPSGSRDDLSNAILPKKQEVTSAKKDSKSKRDKGRQESSQSTLEEDEAQPSDSDSSNQEEGKQREEEKEVESDGSDDSSPSSSSSDS